MNQCVPSWEIEDPPHQNGDKASHHSPKSSTSVKPHISMSHHEVAELTWENGHLAAHGLVKPTPRYPPSVVAGTLECIVDQAKLLNNQITAAAAAAAIDALVPTNQRRQHEDLASGIGSCNNAGNNNNKTKKARLMDNNTVPTVGSRDDTACNTDDFGFTTTNSVSPVFDSNGGSGSPDTANTSFNGGGCSRQLTIVEEDSFCHSRRSQSQKEICGEEDDKVTEGTIRSTISTKRSRAAAIHNQSERRRRDKINQKMRILQKLVPNSSKTDKASMLDEVIDYLKQLQAQVTMMSRFGTMPSMMMPMGMQQFQMAMIAQMAQMAQMTQMAQMGIGIGGPQMPQMGMGMMDMSLLNRAGPPTGTSPILPTSAFMPMIGGGAWDPPVDHMQQAAGVVTPDPFSKFVACPEQQHVAMDAHQRMAAMYQKMFHQNQSTNPK